MTSPHGIFPDKPGSCVKVKLHPVCAVLSAMNSYGKGMRVFFYHVVATDIYSCSSYCSLTKFATLKLIFKIWDPAAMPDILFSY